MKKRKDNSTKSSPGSIQVMLRFDEYNLSMLDKLCESYNNNRSVILRMAMKQLYDRTFAKKGESR